MKRILSLIVFTGIAIGSYAQQVLTLDSCRTLALANNKELRISQEKINAARYQKKAAFTNFLPKIDVMGAYMRTQKEISLLSDEQKQTISNIGTATGAQLQEALQQLGASNPMLGSLLQPLAGMIPGLSAGLNGIGQGIVDAFRTKHDIRNRHTDAAAVHGRKDHRLQQDHQICRTAGPITTCHRHAGSDSKHRSGLLAGHFSGQ